MENREKIARYLLEIQAVKLQANNPFTWASGISSPIYCDNRLLLSYPFVRNEVKKAMIQATESIPTFDTVAGVATAGIPHGALLADALGLPFIYIRSQAKNHGRHNQIEGNWEKANRVLVVEDLISTGGSSMEAIRALLENHIQVVGLLAIFTYEFSSSAELFKSEQIPVLTLTDYSTLLKVALELNYVTEREKEILSNWKNEPEKWVPSLTT